MRLEDNVRAQALTAAGITTRTRIASLLLIAGLAPLRMDAQAQPRPQRFVAAVLSRVGQHAAGVLEITIDRWSTLEDRVLLAKRLRASGVREAAVALRDFERVGEIRAGDDFVREVRYAWEYRGAGSARQLLLLVDRPFRVDELLGRPLIRDHMVSFITL
jgi:hypothetical protein